MKLKMFSIRDCKAELYNPPSYFHNEGQATRQFSDAINNPETPYGQHPEDYTLFRIGTYDDETAEITPESPIALGVGVEFLKPHN